MVLLQNKVVVLTEDETTRSENIPLAKLSTLQPLPASQTRSLLPSPHSDRYCN